MLYSCTKSLDVVVVSSMPYHISSYKSRIQINAYLDYRPGGFKVLYKINAGPQIKAGGLNKVQYWVWILAANALYIDILLNSIKTL